MLEIGSERFKSLSLARATDPVPTLIAFQERAAPRCPVRARSRSRRSRAARDVVGQVRHWRQRLEAISSGGIVRRRPRLAGDTRVPGVADGGAGISGSQAASPGPCSLAGTDLEGRFERLLSDLRSRWTTDVGAQALQAIGVLRDRADRLEASLNRERAERGRLTAAASAVDTVRRLRPTKRWSSSCRTVRAHPVAVPESHGTTARSSSTTRVCGGLTSVQRRQSTRLLPMARRRTGLVDVGRQPRSRVGTRVDADRRAGRERSVAARVASDSSAPRGRRDASTTCGSPPTAP